MGALDKVLDIETVNKSPVYQSEAIVDLIDWTADFGLSQTLQGIEFLPPQVYNALMVAINKSLDLTVDIADRQIKSKLITEALGPIIGNIMESFEASDIIDNIDQIIGGVVEQITSIINSMES